MVISAKNFEKIKDIYICPDPQGHRPVWIWWSLVEDNMYVQAVSTKSTWWNAAVKSLTGQITINKHIYTVKFSKVFDNELINKIHKSYALRYSYKPAIKTYKSVESTKTLLKVDILERIS